MGRRLCVPARADAGGRVRRDPGAPWRQRLHHRAVDAVLGTRHAAADVIAAAGHALAAGPAADPAEAATLVDRAAHLAAASFGFDVAVGLAEARLPLLRRSAPAAEQAAADVDVARLRLRAGRGYDRVVELLERALGTYLSLGDTEAAGMVHSRLGGTLVIPHPDMDVVRSLEHFAAAERLLPRPPSSSASIAAGSPRQCMPSTPRRWPRRPSGAPRSPGPPAGPSWWWPPSGVGAGSPSTSAGRLPR